MIVNPDSLATLQIEWQGVVQMRERMRNLVVTTFAFSKSVSPAFGDIFYNLPFLLAFDVLKQVLLQARDDGSITSSRNRLADLLESAETSLPWIDWQQLKEAVKRRNEVTRDGKLLGDVQCLQDIAAVEAQLQAWGIIGAV